MFKIGMTAQQKHDDVLKARDLVDEAWDKLREAQQLYGIAGCAWRTQIDIRGIKDDLERLSNDLVDKANELLEDIE